MSYQSFLERIAESTGIVDTAEAEGIAECTLRALSHQLDDAQARELATHLPGRLGNILLERIGSGSASLDEFLAEIAEGEHTHRGFAIEHAQVVCQTLTSMLPPEALHRLTGTLPPPFAHLFAARPRTKQPVPPSASAGRGHTLATGRPGGRRPISDSRPPPPLGQRLANGRSGGSSPLADGRPGLPDGETIGTGRPGGAHPLSNSKPPRR